MSSSTADPAVAPAAAPVRTRSRITSYRAVLLVGILARLVLIPITHGQDFVVWDKASAAVLNGVNFYANHPHYPGGPFAYFPLWVYLEVPFQWLAQGTGVPFQILGKLPIFAGDLATATLINRELRERGRNGAVGSALFFVNPLVLYNGAFYGRFDSVACALALLAVRQVRRGSGSAGLAYGLAVAAKTYPVFLLAGMFRAARGARTRLIALLVLVPLVLSLPYLGSMHAMVHDIALYDARKRPQGLSWVRLAVAGAPGHTVHLVGDGLLLAFCVGTLLLAAVRDVYCYAAATLLLFVVCSKVVLEQYLLWPLPFLAVIAVVSAGRLRAAATSLVVLLTAAGMVANPFLHPWGEAPTPLLIGLAAGCGAGVVALAALSPTPRPRSRRSAAASPSRLPA